MHKLPTCVRFAALALCASPALAQVIEFETIPGAGVPSEGDPISTQYLASHGVSFSLEGGGFPVIAQVGAPRTAFGGPPGHTGHDNPLPSQSLGSFFLTDDGVVGAPPPALIISYASPVALAGGVVIDIDGTEGWDIQARDGSGSILATVSLSAGQANTGDGVATPWSFIQPSADITSLRIEYTGVQQVVGLALDNFSPSGLTALNYCTAGTRRGFPDSGQRASRSRHHGG